MSEEPRKIKVYHNAGTVTIRIPHDIVKDIGITADTKEVVIRRPDKKVVSFEFP